MITSPESHEAERLCALLKLKRYELPPPGYFHGFSARVIARIEAEAAEEPLSWWQGLLLRFDAKPILACAYTVALGGLLVVGMGFSQALDSGPANHLPAQGSWLATLPVSTPVPRSVPADLEAEVAAFPAGLDSPRNSSMEPVWSSGAPSFLTDGAGQWARGAGASVERAGFRLQGR